jgi:hypothetical protein
MPFEGLATLAKPKPEKKPASAAPATRRILPMDLQLEDRIVYETGEYEVVGRPYTTAAGRNAHVRVRRVDNAEVAMIRSYSAHERISVKRTTTEEGSRGRLLE